MKQIIEKNGGFTLIEVLVSITIFSIILLGMMTFFTNGLSYVKENESKTVATQVARNVMNYMEKQDFQVMEGYLTKSLQLESATSNGAPYYIHLNRTHCSQIEDLHVKPFPTAMERREWKAISIFKDPSQCESILASKINNSIFNETNVNVYLMKYNDKQHLSRLTSLIESNDPSINLPPSISDVILQWKDNPPPTQSESVDNHLLRVFVVVDWKDMREEVLIQGVISHESIR
ncbi:prepilin-type N-terminal cleavage/methylation domain-containing protein [Bacillus tianshenii]|uniref:type IV pilus modification PilV family protein n=1 Tax=Sutcliffiella tianshenii TaxID=1463404 RepID=UPI001CD55BED|nr:prepilin-type N-terminal cleavage/methylation domain-containing protein [Bacillus tianshenii]MCA1318742.1 prepilin-type N-terminal cleavage/methylation domain-containing protein [Bacillus tianshenii]